MSVANNQMEQFCGVSDFFGDTKDFSSFFAYSDERSDKDEYGDWQTDMSLALSVCSVLKAQGISPQVVIEPTCGKGHFIRAALLTFDSIEDIYGVEIYKPYLDELKMQILQYRVDNAQARNVRVHLHHQNVFDFDFGQIRDDIKGRKVLVLGNPPWVTNSKLGEIKSENLPMKSNFKKIKGLAAITGKGNFDIAEYICYQIVRAFSEEDLNFAMLVKNSVIKNILYEQAQRTLPLTGIRQYKIDAKKEFGVSVSASLLNFSLGKSLTKVCQVYDFYSQCREYEYGWVEDKFVADVSAYVQTKNMDGVSQLKWWSGLKHDCAKIMELSLENGHYVNGLGEVVDIESEMIYPLLKSSDIKGGEIKEIRKYVIVTQHSTSEDTKLLQESHPKAYQYLLKYAEMLDHRGSSIYKNRSRFCLFGIGGYSFKKYKVVVSGLYKHTSFSLIGPVEGKVVMLDDTCYLLGFDTYDEALITQKILNSALVQNFIRSLAFYDAKRVVNKDLLMRINLLSAVDSLGNDYLRISDREFIEYKEMLKSNIIPVQGVLF